MADKPERRFLSREDILNAPEADPNDQEKWAEKWATEDVTVMEVAEQYAEAGRRLADGEQVDFSFAPPGVLYDVTDGRAGTPGNGKAPGVVLILSSILRSEYKKRLAERYIEETGCTLHQAAVLPLLRKRDWLVLQRLTKEDRATFEASFKWLKALKEYCDALANAFLNEDLLLAPVEPLPPLSAEDVAEARAIVLRSLDNGTEESPGTWHSSAAFLEGSYLEHAAASKAAQTVRELMPLVEMTEDDATAAIADVLADGREDSEHRPLSPRDWLAAQGKESALEALELGLERLAREDAESQLEEANRRAEEAERKLAEEKDRRKQRPALRQSTGFLRAIMQRGDHVATTRKRERVAGRLTAEESAARKLFKYEPLGWAERLAIHGLATIARDAGLLDAHPWALTSRPLAGMEAVRVALAFPGISELARVAGFEPGASGKIASEHRKTMTRALQSLVTVPRWIAQPVLVRVGKKLVEDVEVTQELWVVARGTILTRRAELLLHPVAFASHLASFVEVGNLAARYDTARRAIGQRQMLDEWVICDDYLRYRASVKAFDRRLKLERGHAATAGERMVTAGEVALNASVSDATLRAQLGITHLARDRGESKTRRRVEHALAFAQAMGTLQAFTLEEGKEGPVWRLELAETNVKDSSQGLLPLG